MLTFTVLTCFVSAAIGVTLTKNGQYDTRYNHLDITRILNNKRLVNYYAQCLVEKGPCPPQGTEFKRILPEALQTNCARCTEKQRTTAYLAIRRLKKEFPKVWAELQANWDPTGELVSRFINDVETGQETPADTEQLNTLTNIIETGTIPPLSTSTEEATTVQIVLNRFGGGETENDITGSSVFTENIVPSTAPYAPLANSQTTEKTQSTDKSESTTEASSTPVALTSETTNAPDITPFIVYGPPILNILPVDVNPSTISYDTTTNYRIATRPNRFTIFLPRPDLGLRLTANLIGQIGDIGTKVIRTGARIADMMISSVQATLG